MGINGKREYLESIRERYRIATKKQKRKILDEFCAVCEYNRKYAIGLLRGLRNKRKSFLTKRKGRPRKYADPVIVEVLKCIWRILNLPCSKRLKAALPLWLPFYNTFFHKNLDSKQSSLLLSISPSTIDRLMAPVRASAHKYGLSTTKPGSLLKRHIPIATDQWDERRPGFLEADTVAHCGTTTEGMYVLTINCIDLATSWREQRAIWGKGERGVLSALKDIEGSLPFPILGFDCDNGSEFLNWPIHKYFIDRKCPVQFTRSRPYHKNDNAHVEEKNWTLVRQYLGYQRFAQPHLAKLLDSLYCSQWRLLMNFFIPSTKLIAKKRVGAKIKKLYDEPQTPFQRLLLCPEIPESTKTKLQDTYSKLNPFILQNMMKKKIHAIVKQADPLPRYLLKKDPPTP
jgi:hypothetical protein